MDMYAASQLIASRGQQITVTLLLPAELSSELSAYFRARRYPRAALIHNLVAGFALHLVRQRPLAHDVPRTRYQQVGLKLVRTNMKVDWEVWGRLQILARGMGVSACLLAVYLIKLELHGAAQGVQIEKGVPTRRYVGPAHNRKVTLRTSLTAEMTRSILIRRIVLRQAPRDPHTARMMRLVKANQRNWARTEPKQ